MTIPDIIQKELDLLPLPYTVERGKRHLKIRVDGKFVGILPLGATKDQMGGRGGLNVRSNIRRIIRQRAAQAIS